MPSPRTLSRHSTFRLGFSHVGAQLIPRSALSLRTLVPLLGLMMIANVVSAAFPSIVFHRPLGITRGGEATITIHGAQLADTRQILFDQPGIEVLEIKPIDATKAELKVKTENTLAPGRYSFRVVTASGVSNIRYLSVGAMEIVTEIEPNNEFDSPQDIPMDRTVEGNIDREDVDYFRVNLKAGQKLTVEIEGIRQRTTLRNNDILDPFVAILNDKRFEVAVSDDSFLAQQDSICSFTPEEDGAYTIMVRDSSFLGQANVCGYRLHVGSFPRPTTVLPAGAVEGSVLKADVIDIDGTVSESSVQIPTDLIKDGSTDVTKPWPILTQDARGVSPSPNYVRVGQLPIVLEAEPNNDHRNAPVCEVPALLCGVISEPDDYDCFSFVCKNGQNYRVKLYARETLRSPLDGVINLFDKDGKTLKSADDVGGKLDGFLDFTATYDGPHTVRVYDHLRDGSPLHNYAIEVSFKEPSFSLDLKELRRDEAMVVPVPIGGHGAMVVTAKRESFNDEIALALEGLPEGVTAQTFPIPSGRVEMPIILKAAGDAKLDASLFEIRGEGKLGDKVVKGELTQYHKIVLGQNQRAMLDDTTDRAAVAVCEKMPFEVELVQPKTPILRRGSKELIVRIKRDEKFEAPVSIKTLYNPPGIGVNNSRQIAKDQAEVTIPVTANNGTPVGPWPMIMQISYGTQYGTATYATAPIMLEVEMPVFDYQFPRAAAELGQTTDLVITMSKIRDIEGEIEVELVGMPNGVSSPAPKQKVTVENTTVTFPLVIAEDAKTGSHKTLNVQTRITRDGETMVQTDGTGEIRIDKPLPKKEPKAEAEKKPEQPKPEPKPEAKAKPLSRLEQLRQQKEGS